MPRRDPGKPDKKFRKPKGKKPSAPDGRNGQAGLRQITRTIMDKED